MENSITVWKFCIDSKRVCGDGYKQDFGIKKYKTVFLPKRPFLYYEQGITY